VKRPTTNGVMVSMAWVNMMARIQTDGLPVNVGPMMDEFAVQNGVDPNSASSSSLPAGITF
jgi:hypothetical protein